MISLSDLVPTDSTLVKTGSNYLTAEIKYSKNQRMSNHECENKIRSYLVYIKSNFMLAIYFGNTIKSCCMTAGYHLAYYVDKFQISSPVIIQTWYLFCANIFGLGVIGRYCEFFFTINAISYSPGVNELNMFMRRVTDAPKICILCLWHCHIKASTV